MGSVKHQSCESGGGKEGIKSMKKVGESQRYTNTQMCLAVTMLYRETHWGPATRSSCSVPIAAGALDGFSIPRLLCKPGGREVLIQIRPLYSHMPSSRLALLRLDGGMGIP